MPLVSRVLDLNGVAQLHSMLEIYHAGLEPSIFKGESLSQLIKKVEKRLACIQIFL